MEDRGYKIIESQEPESLVGTAPDTGKGSRVTILAFVLLKISKIPIH